MPNYCFIVVSGEIHLSVETSHLGTYQLKPGQFVGDFPNILNGTPYKTSVRVVEDSKLLLMDKSDFADFVRSNPGLLVFFKDKFIVE